MPLKWLEVPSGPGNAISGGLVREVDSRSESSGVGGIDIGGGIRGRVDGVIAGDIDRLDEDLEVAGGDVVGVVPVDHASRPVNDTLGTSIDTSGPHTGVGVKMSGSFKTRETEEIIT